MHVLLRHLFNRLLPKSYKFFTAISSVFFSFLILEVIIRLYYVPPRGITIENHMQQGVDVKGAFIEASNAPENGLYFETPTGLRLKRNMLSVIKNHQISKKDITITTNSLGFRYKELSPKTDNDYRILVLGDSIIFSDYTSYEETIPAFMETLFQNASPAALLHKNVQVINAGVGGIGLENELAILKEAGLSVHPDAVILSIFLNDAQGSYYQFLKQPPDFIAFSQLASLMFITIQKIYPKTTVGADIKLDGEVDSFIKNNPAEQGDWRNNDLAFNKLIADNYIDWGYGWSDKFITKIDPLIGIMSQLATDNNFKLVVILTPVRYQAQSKIMRDEPQIRLGDILTKYRIKYLDLLPILRTKFRNDSIDIFYDPAHYQPEGNMFVAQEIVKFLTSNIP